VGGTNVKGGWVGVGAACRGGIRPGGKGALDRPRPSGHPPTQPQLTFAGPTANDSSYREYAAGTPPSTLSMFPVLLPDRAGEAKCRTAWAMSSGKMFTPSVVRLR